MYCPNPDCPHREATGEPARYRHDVDRCADCGAVLVPDPPEEKDKLEYEPFVPVLTLSSPGSVPFVHSLLGPTGMRYFVKGEGPQALLGAVFTATTGPFVVLVEPDRADEARALLADLAEEAREDERAES